MNRLCSAFGTLMGGSVRCLVVHLRNVGCKDRLQPLSGAAADDPGVSGGHGTPKISGELRGTQGKAFVPSHELRLLLEMKNAMRKMKHYNLIRTAYSLRMSNTNFTATRTNEALAALLERDGELSEDNAPEVLVKLCRELEADAETLREQVGRSQAAATVWYRRCAGEDPEWGDTKDTIVGKAISLVNFWEGQGAGNCVMARAKEDALILACGYLHNV